MKRYGLRIGDVGIEFPSREEREKALKAFTLGCDVKIHVSGVKYRDGSGTFSVYERLLEEILVICNECKGVFGVDVCPMREYPHKNSWEEKYDTATEHICDACFASAIKSKEVFDAKKLLDKEL